MFYLWLNVLLVCWKSWWPLSKHVRHWVHLELFQKTSKRLHNSWICWAYLLLLLVSEVLGYVLWHDNFCPSLSRSVYGESCVLSVRKTSAQASTHANAYASMRYLFVYLTSFYFLYSEFISSLSRAFRFRIVCGPCSVTEISFCNLIASPTTGRKITTLRRTKMRRRIWGTSPGSSDRQ